MASSQTYSVGAITSYIKDLLENNGVLRDVWVNGEISNLTHHASGHVYFSLKDEEAQLSCVMFRQAATQLRGKFPQHGAKVNARGGFSVYPPRGAYQLIVRELELAGVGDLHKRFIELRDRLRAEGIFSKEHKQSLPAFPRRIGIATSPTGAVIRDIINTIQRRYPHVELVLAPTVVQGDAGADSIVKSLEMLNRHAGLDLIILARGGGSLEDLWCFNEERVARAIFASKLPVVSGVGHETDTTIADFVADVRAATPTAAAELAVPLADEIAAMLRDSGRQMGRSLQHFIEFRQQLLDDCQRQILAALTKPLEQNRLALDRLQDLLVARMMHQTEFKKQVLEDYLRRLESTASNMIEVRRGDLKMMEAGLSNLDLRKVMERGFTVTMKDGVRISDSGELTKGDMITTHYYIGKTISKIETKD